MGVAHASTMGKSHGCGVIVVYIQKNYVVLPAEVVVW
jgi:hypothetical protein